MGYTVDLQEADLRCRSEADARAAAALVPQHAENCPRHFNVEPWCPSNPCRDDAWKLSVEYFEGDHWDSDEAAVLWLALAPHLADGATIEFQGEDLYRWRIRWEGGRVFEEQVESVQWTVVRELQPPQKDGAS